MRKWNINIIGLAVILAAATIPIGNVSAANGWEEDLSLYAKSVTASSVTISIGSGSNTTLSPGRGSNGTALGTIKRTASVKLGATDGYTIKVSGNPTLTGTASSAHTIPSVTTATTLPQMSNQWGWNYAVGDVGCSESGTYRAMTSAGETVDSGALSSAATKTLTMCFGANVNSAQASDNYSGTVTVSAVAEPRTVITSTKAFGGITYMQDMTTNACQNASVNETAQLIDRRDSKKYWVTKMLDGNCWMSQNLDFNISTNNVTTAYSDVTSNWTSSSTYPPTATVSNVDIGSAGIGLYRGTYSWNFGDYVMTNPTTSKNCGYNNTTGLGVCPDQFTNVSGWTASTDPNFYRKNGDSPIDSSARVYDAHYLAGNYYQWNAATAGTGATTALGANAPSSVCPKGWILPNSGDNTSSGSFHLLFYQYGVNYNTLDTSPINGYTYDIARSPLFYVRGGTVVPSVPKFNDVGEFGYYWSSRASSSSSSFAHLLRFYTYVNAFTNDSYRDYGTSLRCLIKTS